MFGTPHPFHSHCQRTHSLHNHEMSSKVQKTELQNYLLFCKYTVSKSPGEKITFFFSRPVYFILKIHQKLGKHLGKPEHALICCAESGINNLQHKWVWMETQKSGQQITLLWQMFVLTELAARPGQHLESSRSDKTSGKQMVFFLTFQNALYSTEECKSH